MGSDTGRSAVALYDEQCEICQAMVSWIRVLDRSGAIECVPLGADSLDEHHPSLELDDCLRQLHVVADGEVAVGWGAVVAIARRLPSARPIAWLDRFGPTRWLARRAYEWLAVNRYELSKCRGGACSVDRPELTRRRASLRAFWTCYNLGLLLRLPLIAATAIEQQADHVATHIRTYRRRVELLDGRLRLLFLGGAPTDVVPLVFGERFAAVVYRGVLVDPGSVKMRRSVMAHLDAGQLDDVDAVTVTHHHEEHSGNLEWIAGLLGKPLAVNDATAASLRSSSPIPPPRRFFIGQPPPLTNRARPLGDRLTTPQVTLEVIPASGHSPDHVVLWDPEERVLLVGDAFLGAYFSSPNPEVDSLAWIETLERLIALGPEVMVEGHGRVHTVRSDIPEVPGVVDHQDPVAMLTEKLDVLLWVREQVESGLQEGIPVRAIEASCFPWGMRWSWENVVADETARLLTGGEFSRSELVRSFRRRDDDTPLPDLRSVRLIAH